MKASVSEEHRRSAEHIKSITTQTFNSDSGKLLMEYLIHLYLDQPVFSKDVQGDKQATHAAYREGQNSVVRQLVSVLNAKG